MWKCFISQWNEDTPLSLNVKDVTALNTHTQATCMASKGKARVHWTLKHGHIMILCQAVSWGLPIMTLITLIRYTDHFYQAFSSVKGTVRWNVGWSFFIQQNISVASQQNGILTNNRRRSWGLDLKRKKQTGNGSKRLVWCNPRLRESRITNSFEKTFLELESTSDAKIYDNN